MPETPFISVIVPAFNAEKTLPQCLRRLKEQTDFDDYEVIVVDDGSADQTAAIASQSGCTLIRMPTNQGTARARNAGAQKARGEIILFVDADVALGSDALSRLASFFDDHPEVDAAVGTYTEDTSSGSLVAQYHNYFTFYHHDLSDKYIEWFWGAIGAVRRWVFEAVGGFDERFQGASAEDIDLGYVMAMAGRKIAYLRDVRGEHLHRFTLRSMLFNDYRKAVLGLKLYLTRKRPGRHEHGFSNPRNAATLIMVYLLVFCLVFTAAGLIGPLTILLCILVLIWVNRPFYQFIAAKSTARFFLVALLLHWLSFFVIGLGVIMGLLGLLAGKPLHSKSPWM